MSVWPLPSVVDAKREESYALLERVAEAVSERRLAQITQRCGEIVSFGPHGYPLACAYLKATLRDIGVKP